MVVNESDGPELKADHPNQLSLVDGLPYPIRIAIEARPLTVWFRTAEAREQFAALLGRQIAPNIQAIWYPAS